MGATYRFYKCIKCGKNSKTERVFEGLNFGNPFYTCKSCGELNYDRFIVEPALLNPKVLIQDGKKKYNTLLLLLYMPIGLCAFFAISLWLESFILGLIIVAILIIPLTILILRKKTEVTIQDYMKEINESISRLESNMQYAQMVIQLQGNDLDSVWSQKYLN